MEWKVLFVPLTQYAYSNHHDPAGYERLALDALTEAIAQGYKIQMSHVLDVGSDRHYVWVYLTRAKVLL